MPFRTGVKLHDDAILAAENVRQAAIVPGASMATVRAADVAFARAARSSSITNNGSSGVEQFSTMLRELGTSGA